MRSCALCHRINIGYSMIRSRSEVWILPFAIRFGLEFICNWSLGEHATSYHLTPRSRLEPSLFRRNAHKVCLTITDSVLVSPWSSRISITGILTCKLEWWTERGSAIKPHEVSEYPQNSREPIKVVHDLLSLDSVNTWISHQMKLITARSE